MVSIKKEASNCCYSLVVNPSSSYLCNPNTRIKKENKANGRYILTIISKSEEIFTVKKVIVEMHGYTYMIRYITYISFYISGIKVPFYRKGSHKNILSSLRFQTPTLPCTLLDIFTHFQRSRSFGHDHHHHHSSPSIWRIIGVHDTFSISINIFRKKEATLWKSAVVAYISPIFYLNTSNPTTESTKMYQKTIYCIADIKSCAILYFVH